MNHLVHSVQGAKRVSIGAMREGSGCCPFFVVPLVVSSGEYIPLEMRLEAQVNAFEYAQMGNIAEYLATRPAFKRLRHSRESWTTSARR